MRIAVPDRTSFLAIDVRDGIVVVELELAPGSRPLSPSAALLSAPTQNDGTPGRSALKRPSRHLPMIWAGAMLASFIAGAILFHSAPVPPRAVAAAIAPAPPLEELGMAPLAQPAPRPPLAVPEAHPGSSDFGLD